MRHASAPPHNLAMVDFLTNGKVRVLDAELYNVLYSAAEVCNPLERAFAVPASLPRRHFKQPNLWKASTNKVHSGAIWASCK